MAEVNTNAGNVRLIGGRLCLDFVNTVDSHKQAQPKEYLVSYEALVVWGHHAGALDERAGAALLAAAARRPGDAVAALRRAQGLRKALYTLFAGLATGRGAPAADLAVLNDTLAVVPCRAQIVPASSGFAWVWDSPGDSLEQPLWPVAWSTADLLTSAELANVRECAGEGCSWLFLDTSRNRSRRWCSMEDCGNRAKARRHYARRQAGHYSDGQKY
jgi:predicted RNA-binding Zn ribbon-like protein